MTTIQYSTQSKDAIEHVDKAILEVKKVMVLKSIQILIFQFLNLSEKLNNEFYAMLRSLSHIYYSGVRFFKFSEFRFLHGVEIRLPR